MKLVLLGSGNVAYHLAKIFTQKGIEISQIFGRNANNLQEISLENNIPFSTTTLEDADFYLIAVSDGAVEEVSNFITKENCLVAHTSGSLPIEILGGNYRKGSFYPLQTFSKSKSLNFENIPFFVESDTLEDLALMRNLASQISSNVEISSFEKRKYVHLSAVFACNFVNHLFARSKQITDEHDIPFHYLYPLIDETVQKIKELEPKAAQTGPSVRNDTRVIEMQKELIEGELLKIYTVMNDSIKEMYEL